MILTINTYQQEFGLVLSRNGLLKSLFSWLKRLFYRNAVDAVASFSRIETAALREKFFLEIVERNSELISRICRSFAGKGSEFEDLKQDVLLNIWKGINDFRHDANIKTWIYRIALNTCVSTYRRQSKRGVTVGIDTAYSLSSADSETWENAQWLAKMVSSLSPMDHSIIMMWLDDLAYEEIAEVMGMNRNTVATRVRRIKMHLKHIYETKRI